MPTDTDIAECLSSRYNCCDCQVKVSDHATALETVNLIYQVWLMIARMIGKIFHMQMHSYFLCFGFLVLINLVLHMKRIAYIWAHIVVEH